MKTYISAILICLGIAMMVRSGDCDGKCMENANSLLEMFMYAFRQYGIDDIWWIFNVKNSITNKRTITMIKVEKTAKTLDEGIKNLMSGKQDYVRMSALVVENLLVIQKNKLIIGITKQKFHKVRSTLRLYKILVFLFYCKRRLLNILKKVIY